MKTGLTRYTEEEREFLVGIMEIAKKRTRCHLTALQMVDFDLSQLLVNVYMQGVYDMSQALISRNLINESQEVADYQI